MKIHGRIITGEYSSIPYIAILLAGCLLSGCGDVVRVNPSQILQLVASQTQSATPLPSPLQTATPTIMHVITVTPPKSTATTESKSLLKTIQESSDMAYSLAFSPDGKELVEGTFNGLVNVWDVNTGNMLQNFTDQKANSNIMVVAFSSDGMHIAAGGGQGKLDIWNWKNGILVWSIIANQEGVYAIAFSPSGSMLASGGIEDPVKLWNTKTGSNFQIFSGLNDGVYSIAFSPNGRFLALGGCEDTGRGNISTIKMYDLQNSTLLYKLDDSGGRCIQEISFSSNGLWLASIGSAPAGGFLRVWKVSTGNKEWGYDSEWSLGLRVAFSPDNEHIATEGENKGENMGGIWIWDTTTQSVVKKIDAHTDDISALSFSPDGSRLASGSRDHTIKIWDISF